MSRDEGDASDPSIERTLSGLRPPSASHVIRQQPHMKHFAALILAFGCLGAEAGPEVIYGSWEGGDAVSMSTYGFLYVSERYVSWGRKAGRPECRAAYVIVSEPEGTTFENQTRKEFSVGPNMTFQTYLLQIQEIGCRFDRGYLRLTVDPSIGMDYLELVEYSPKRKEQAWMHFHKR